MIRVLLLVLKLNPSESLPSWEGMVQTGARSLSSELKRAQKTEGVKKVEARRIVQRVTPK